MSVESVPCPGCCNGHQPGQLVQPPEGWPNNEFPSQVKSVPCPVCHGTGKVSREAWDELMGRAKKAIPKKKPKKTEEQSTKLFNFWEDMKAIRKERDKEWQKQGPFPFSSYKKVD